MATCYCGTSAVNNKMFVGGCMQLTERQCWKVIRNLVADKNKEFSDFFKEAFGSDWERNRNLLGYTRDAFLNKFGFYRYKESNPVHLFNDYVAEKGKKPSSVWMEDLSTSDLILFLDFRCNTLQQLYDYYKKHGIIEKEIVEEIVDNTPICELAKCNRNRLEGTSKPPRIKGEAKLMDMSYTQAQLNEWALSQALGYMAGKYASKLNVSMSQAEEVASNVTTYNTDLGGRRTGYKVHEEIKAHYIPAPAKKVEVLHEDNENKGKMHLVGFTGDMHPVFEKDGQLVNLFSEPITAPVMYDKDKQPIIFEEGSKRKFVGLDIQGTPVYEDEDGYYNSLGERLDDDVFIDNAQDDILGL